MKINKTKIFSYLSLFLGIFTVSCQTDDVVYESPQLKIGGTITTGEDSETRGEITVKSITHSQFDTPFYVEMVSEGERRFGEYEVAEGQEGQLTPLNADNTLNWLTANGDHTFFSWTLPWVKDTYLPGGSTRSQVSFDQTNEMYSQLAESDRLNCAVLEKFIGAKAGPVNYRENGEYVEIQYQHLVSRIKIGTLTLITSEGNTIRNIRGNITFYGMPATATFDRRPNREMPPVVTGNVSAEDPMTVTYDLGQTAVFYVCPGIDFSKMEFKVHINDVKYNEEGDFYGNFSQVIFNREEYPGWDEGKDKTILYAGEEMTLNLTLTQGHGAGVTLTITDWNIAATNGGKSYSHNGIYTSGQAKDVSNLFASNYTEEEAEEMFGMYGDEIDGEKVFPVYEDIDMGQFSFSMDKDYILDGMGHTVKLQPRSGNPNTVRIGPCRDIYLTDGENTVYIDSDGYVYLVGPDGAKTPTGNQLPELKDNEYTYDINLATGTVSTTRQKS